MATESALLLGNRRVMWLLTESGATVDRQVEQAKLRPPCKSPSLRASSSLRAHFRAGEISQWLRVKAALPENLGSIPSNYMVSHNHPNSSSRRSEALF